MKCEVCENFILLLTHLVQWLLHSSINIFSSLTAKFQNIFPVLNDHNLAFPIWLRGLFLRLSAHGPQNISLGNHSGNT
jgi:hypothetical protein